MTPDPIDKKSSSAKADTWARERASPEPIAIIGIGCRFPGGAVSPASFWRLLRDGVDAVREIPADRPDLRALFSATPGAPGKIASSQGGFLEGLDLFDASFFGISPREATAVDPQQRLLLETTWEAFEDAGIPPERFAGRHVGVYIGMWTNEYEDRLFFGDSDIDLYVTTGGGRYAASGRLSYAFDLRGPSLTLDTACSSSLVAVHLATQSLRSGECDLAIAGASNLILMPHISIGYSRSSMLSPDGRCKFGDASANGYVRAEGVGVVLLKRLSQALADADPIYALVMGSAVNNDGQSSGSLVAPGVRTQEIMLREAYRNAGVDPAQVAFLEAHGTGTAVGDPVELAALGAVLGHGRPADRPCLVGSVKTNIGHTEAASGMAGLIKAALCLKHGEIPPSLHFRHPNPKIPWAELPLKIATELCPLPKDAGPAYAGVNSFGVTGTNAHVVLCSLEGVAHEAALAPAAQRPSVLTLSARSAEALVDQARRARDWLADSARGASLGDIAYTASRRRSHLEHRLAVVGATREAWAERLDAYAHGEAFEGIASGQARDGGRGVVFVFSGQGPQWWAMGRELMETESTFRAELERCDEALRPHTGRSVIADLRADRAESRLGQTEFAQPALFSLQVGLAALWHAWGITPSAVVGHSMGEIAAGCVSGALSLEQGARIVAHRGRIMQRATGLGNMAAVDLPAAELEPLLAGLGDRLSVAAVNGPASAVVSGETAALEEFLQRLATRGVSWKRLPVDYAFHSPQMERFQAELAACLDGLSPARAARPIVSTVTGQFLEGPELDARYWARNLRAPVLFAPAVERLLADGHSVFVELSPHPVLCAYVMECARARGMDVTARPSLRREADEQATLLESLGALHVSGVAVAWERLYPAGRVVSLPGYAWQRERYWHEHAAMVSNVRASEARAAQTEAAAPVEAARADPTAPFQLVWRPANATAAADAPRGPWLILVDDRGIGEALAARLAASARVVTVRKGAAFARLGADAFQVRVGREEDLSRVFVECGGNALAAWVGVVHLWSLDSGSLAGDAEAWDRAYEAGPLSVLPLVRALAGTSEGTVPRLWLVTGGAQAVAGGDILANPAAALLWGLGRVIASEHPRMCCTCMDLPSAPGEADVVALAAVLNGIDAENQLAIREGDQFVPRLIRPQRGSRRPPSDPATLVVPGDGPFRAEVWAPGSPDGATFVASQRPSPGPGEVELQVVASGLNFMNALSVMGACPGYPDGVGPLGGDCAGIVLSVGAGVTSLRPGDAVFGVAFDSLGSHAVADARLFVRKPDALSFEAAATVPIAFLTAYYSLKEQARLRAGERVLVHAAAGGVGRAALQIASLLGAQVLATAGRPEKREWLHSQGITFVADSRGTTFADEVLEATGGRGVDVVLNCLTGDAIGVGLRALAPGGRFVEIGKLDIHRGTQLPLAPFRKGLAYFAVDLDRLVREEPAFVGQMLGELLALLEQGRLYPLPHQTFSAARLGDALRLMTEARNMGKLVVSLASAARVEPMPLRDGHVAEGTYLITGGLGGLGLRTARWLVARGAGRVVLAGRRAPGPQALKAIDEMRRAGAEVQTAQVDVADREALGRMLAEIDRQTPPLVGVVHAAGVLDDCTVLDMTPERFRSVTAAKAEGAWHLHELTRERPLSVFLLYSSIAPLVGLVGQGNYAAANAFLDALAAHRRRLGLAATSIAWGPWAEVGLAAVHENRGGRLASRGMPSLAPDDALARLERVLIQAPVYAAVFDVDWALFREAYPEVAAWSIFAEVCESGTDAAAGAGDIRAAALLAEPGRPRRQLIEERVRGLVARVLRRKSSSIEVDKPLRSLGLDSLMGLELRNLFVHGFGVGIPATLIWNFPTVSALSGELARRAGVALEHEAASVQAALADAAPDAASGDGSGAKTEDLVVLLQELEQMSEGDASQELQGEARPRGTA